MLLNIVVLVILLAIIGFATYMLTTNVSMSDGMKQLINGVVFFFCLIWVVMLFFGLAPWPTLPLTSR